MIAAIISSIIFLLTLYLVFSEKLNRTIAALAGAVLMITFGLVFGFYTEADAISYIDFNTLGLLFGMMVIVAVLEPTGFFQYLAIRIGKRSKGKPILLLVLLGTITTFISMFLDNVTTVVLIAPVTILICEILGLNPQPYLMGEAILSDTGGVATLIGDPPNILIGSASGFTFLDFITHSLPVVVIVWLSALMILSFLFRKELSELPTNIESLDDLRPETAFKDQKNARKVLIVIGLTIIAFFFEGFLHIKSSLIAIIAASVVLILVKLPIAETLKRIQWDVLVFFASLFVIIGGMQSAGVMSWITSMIMQSKNVSPVIMGLIILWVIAILSAFIDNVPVTIALIPLIQGLGTVGYPITPLWWALVFGAGFGGNGTIIGSTANIIVSSLSEKTNSPITPKVWNKKGLPVMIGTCLVTTIIYILFFDLLSH